MIVVANGLATIGNKIDARGFKIDARRGRLRLTVCAAQTLL
jgi:hypothetical protein